MIYAGLDISQCPSDDKLALIAEKTNVVFVAQYLGPAPCHPETDWMDKLPRLKQLGLGTAAVFVGRQLTPQLAGGGQVLSSSAQVAAQQGQQDGNLAADLMTKAGYATGSCVYLDIENGPPLTLNQRLYMQAWAAAVRTRQFVPGVYVSHLLAAQVAGFVPGARIWEVRVPSVQPHDASAYGSSFPTPAPEPGCTVWQREEEAEINIHAVKLTVDLDTSTLRDPSAP